MSRTTLLAGGVGGARLARGVVAVVPEDDLTIVVNVGDDERIYGVHVSADLDTVTYTLAEIVGPQGWGIADDTFTVMDALERHGVDTSFRLGDRDLALCMARTAALDDGQPLSEITRTLAASLGVTSQLIPASDDQVRTRLHTAEAGWLAFQDYFVRRGHQDTVLELEYTGAHGAVPAPGVIEAIQQADRVIIAPSNPPLSIGPILAIDEIRAAVESHTRVIAVSPLFGGKALKGPADRVLASLGHEPGNAGILDFYAELITDLVVDIGDKADADLDHHDVTIHATDTRFAGRASATKFASWLMEV